MTELEARTNLQRILDAKHNSDIMFEETKYTNGTGFVDAQIAQIYKLGDGEWNSDIADSHIATIEDKMLG